MFLTSLNDAAQNVTGAVRKAAAATGTGFDYLLKTAFRESGLNPQAKAPTSSAAGAFQFVEQTWLQVMKEDGPRFGLDDQASQIRRSASGRFTVSSPEARSDILALRYDPEVSALLAGAFTERNRESLTGSIGRAPDDGELYAAHFLGAQGAASMIRLAETNPGASAARAFPEAAAANRSIFYADGKARPVAEVLANLKSKHGGTSVTLPVGSSPAATVAAAHAAFEQPAIPETGPVFHSLYRTGHRQPVNAYVERAWSGLVADPQLAQRQAPSENKTVLANAAPLPHSRPAAPSRPGGPLDLSTFLNLATASNARGRGTV
ncbi:hypothetical protein GCM10007276_26130 [Agaricicola taiwanensis]|uniref:Lytic transglycosylase domain-containing protein n=1 Tax=Agaricicola taiwanensis TaxID=591372 RepID=A0A8J2YJW7_9RHOB|nr:lytic transglycosylase domain-containing protein [Agaricicola taiwanensis]GGE47664.1 hypothetical protein GCM10007276_26130 [Agaricicola taiwanensis]